MLQKLAQVAHELDRSGLYIQADVITEMMTRIAYGEDVDETNVPGTPAYVQPFNQKKRHEEKIVNLGNPEQMEHINNSLGGGLYDELRPHGINIDESHRMINPKTGLPFTEEDFAHPFIMGMDDKDPEKAKYQVIGPSGKTKGGFGLSRIPKSVFHGVYKNPGDRAESTKETRRFMDQLYNRGRGELMYNNFGKNRKLRIDTKTPRSLWGNDFDAGRIVGYDPAAFENYYKGVPGEDDLGRHIRRTDPSVDSIEMVPPDTNPDTGNRQKRFFPNQDTLKRFHG